MRVIRDVRQGQASTTALALATTQHAVFCKRCHYDLHGSPGGACPECGLPFDPDDRTSFHATLEYSYVGTVWIVIGILFGGALVSVLMMGRAWQTSFFPDAAARFFHTLLGVPFVGLMGLGRFWILCLTGLALLVGGLLSTQHRLVAPWGAVMLDLYLILATATFAMP